MHGTNAFTALEAALRGWPDQFLTIGLVGMGVVFILIGLLSPSRVVKAAALAYAIFP